MKVDIVEYLLKTRILEPEKQPLLGNSCVTLNKGAIIGKGVFYAVRAVAI
jgi:hypothetical protein